MARPAAAPALRALLVLAVLALLVGCTGDAGGGSDDAGGPSGSGRRPTFLALEFEARYSDLPAYRGVSFADDLQAEQANVPSTGTQEGRYVNVVDGLRVTLPPPDCAACPHVSVWFSGGSAAFGIGQRDDHTIASELVRQAADRGVALDVTNISRNGATFSQEVDALEARLATEAPPDLVVFYDGWNDVLAEVLTRFLHGDPGSAAPAIDMGDVRAANDRTDDLLRSDVGPAAGRAVARRYAALQDRVAALLEPLGSEPVYFFQADALASARQLASYEDLAGVTAAQLQASPLAVGLDEATASLGDRVHDLRHLFDREADPVFLGLVHQNEAGARTVAARVYRELGSAIERAGAD